MENRNKKALYSYIAEALVDGALPEDFSLPQPEGDEGGLMFADGAMDGISIYHMSPKEPDENAKGLMEQAVQAAAAGDVAKAEELFYALSESCSAVNAAGSLQSYLIAHRAELNDEELYDTALQLLLSDRRECVKFGLIIMELFNCDRDESAKKLVRTLGLSDEFTLYAVRVMGRWKNGNEEIFSLAKKVHGWGRIHAVEALRPSSSAIKKWLLTEAMGNDVLSAYSALSCWEKSDAEFVLKNHPDYEQFAGIRNIIRGLMDEGPVPGFSTLENGDEIINIFLDEAEKMPLEMGDYRAVYEILTYYNENRSPKHPLALKCKKLLHTYRCTCMLIDAAKEGKDVDLAAGVGINVKPYVMELLKRSLEDYSHLLRYLMDDEESRREVLELYRQQLPLEELKAGPALEMGLGQEYRREQALEYLLQELRMHPLEGQDFVSAGLQAAPVRTRSGALYVLEHWVSGEKQPLSSLLPDLQDRLSGLLALEPHAELQERIKKLLSGSVSFEDVGPEEKKPEYSVDSLNILSDAISDVGLWQWWYTGDEMVQLEFGGVQLYDGSKPEKAPHSSTIALRFYGNWFAVFLDDLDDDSWYVKLSKDEIEPFPVQYGNLRFDEPAFASQLMKEYRHRNPLKPGFDESLLSSAKHLLAANCGDVAFIAGGDWLEVVSHAGVIADDDIETASRKWGEYWRDYWFKRGSSDAYEQDYACEVTIPIDSGNPQDQY